MPQKPADIIVILFFIGIVVVPLLLSRSAPRETLETVDTTEGTATIVVDHQQNGIEGAEVAYQIDPTLQLVVDATGYQFQYGESAQTAPNALHMFYGAPTTERNLMRREPRALMHRR